MRWIKDPFQELPPPGNPVRWVRWDLNTLDDFFQIGEQEVVMDIKFCLKGLRQTGQGDSLITKSQRVTIPLATELDLNTTEMKFPIYQPLVDALLVKPMYPADLFFDFE